MMLASSSGGSWRTQVSPDVSKQQHLVNNHQPPTAHLRLPGQRRGVQRRDATRSQNSDGLPVIVHHLEVQVLVVLPPFDLSP